MAPQSYELSFIGSVLVIFITIVLFILAINLFVAIMRFMWRKIWGQYREFRDSATQTGRGEGDSIMLQKSENDGRVEGEVVGSGRKKKKA